MSFRWFLEVLKTSIVLAWIAGLSRGTFARRPGHSDVAWLLNGCPRKDGATTSTLPCAPSARMLGARAISARASRGADLSRVRREDEGPLQALSQALQEVFDAVWQRVSGYKSAVLESLQVKAWEVVFYSDEHDPTPPLEREKHGVPLVAYSGSASAAALLVPSLTTLHCQLGKRVSKMSTWTNTSCD